MRANFVLVVLVSLASSIPQRADGADPQMIPPGSLAFIHIDAPEFYGSPSLKFLKEVAGRVSGETSWFSLARLGVDVTKLSEVTIVAPPWGQILATSAGDTPPLVFIANFANEFQAAEVVERLQSELGLASSENGVLSDNDKLALYVDSDQALVAGSPEGLAWWLGARKQSEDSKLAEALVGARNEAPVIAAVDVTQVPAWFSASLPAAASSLFDAHVITGSLAVDRKLALNLVLHFADESVAGESGQEMEAVVAHGKMLLSLAESATQQSLSNPELPTAEGFGTLAALAGIRQGQAYLDDVTVNQQGAAVRVAAKVHNEVTSTVMVCLTAISAIGAEANREFESIAEQLGNQ